MIFKTLNGDLTTFNKTLISTRDHLKALQTANATVYNKNGAFNLQGLLVNFSQSTITFTKLNNAFKAYNGNLSKSTQLQNAYVQAVGKQNVTLGNYLAGLNGAKASMGGYVKSLVTAKAASIGLRAASIALNTAISMGITFAISGLISQISKWIHAQEEARQKAVELTNSYKEQRDSLNSQIEKYKELKETLDNGNLSANETRSIKEQLLEIQKSLIESYGNEASNIDLVNGKYKEQLGLLSELSKEKATDYVAENRDVFEDAKKELEKIRTYTINGIANWNTLSPKTKDQQALLDFIESYSELFDITADGSSNYASGQFDVRNLVIKADVESADEIMRQFYDDLDQFGKDNNIDVSGILEGISGQLKKTTSDEFKEYKTIYDEYMKAEIVRNDTLRSLYQQSIQAVEDYNEALSSGKGIAEAKANLDSVQQTVQSVTGTLEGSQDIFDGIYDGINKSAESAYNLAQSFENDETVKGYAEQLKGLTDVDLKAINFEDNVKSPGEEAFSALIDILGLSEDEVQNLIDKLVELGYVQGEVQSSTLNIEYPISFSSIFSDESLSKFQSTIDSLKSSLTTLYNGDYSSADLISSLTNINKALSDIGKEEVINWEEITNIDDLDNIIEQITNEYVDEMLESLDMAGTDFGNTIRNVIQEELKASRQLETYKSNVSDLQTAYSNLTDVIETYNANGYITFDQLTSLLEMEPQYLSCLIDENGQLQLNEQAMADLAQLRLDEARTQVVQEAISELNRLSEEKQTQAVNDNSNAYIQNIKTISQWNNALGTAMQNAGLAAPLFAELSSALGGAVSNGASDEAINQVLDNAYKKFQMIGQIQSSIGSNLGGVLGKASSSSGTASSSTDTYEEQFDFFERRVEVLDNAVSLLKANLENLTGSFAKNQLLDQNSNILEERMRNYSDAVRMYQEKAQEALSKLDQETQKKIIDGSVSLTDYIGEENKAVVEAMNDYKGWSDKVAECTEELASLKEELRQLELEKINHIIQDFSDQFDLRDKAKDLIDKQIALFEEAGQLIGKAFYEEQIGQSQKQLSLLENEKAQLVNQLSSAISSGRVQKGTEEWLEMVNALSDVDDSILDCKKSIEEFDNAILNLHWETFDRVQDTFESLSDEISNLIGVMDDADVATIDNQWTKEGLTQLGLYAQQYELATYQVSQYADEIDKLSADYLLGKYSATEYADKLADLNSAQWDAVNAAESAKASIMDLNEARVNIVVEGIREEIDAYKELIVSQITALDAEKDLHEYQNSIAEKSNNIAKLEKQLAAMQNDNTAAAIAKRKQLEEQLAEAKADLDQTQYEHSVETQKEALNQQYQDYEDARNKEIEALEATLKDKENIIASSMESVKQHTQVIATQITDIANQHGVNISNALTSSWASGENAIASYGEVLSQGTSMFIENIMGIENQIFQLQVNADVTAISLANIFSANADNLVNELNTSYFAEANLLNMTNALHDSLISTLQGGYDVSSIVNSLNAVTEAANKARAAASSIGNSNINTASIPAGFNDLDASRKYFVKDENNKTLFVGSPSQCQAWAGAHNYSLGSITGDDINVIDNNKKVSSSSISSSAINIGKKASLKKYASGAKNIEEDQLAITNEAGQELIYHAADGSILTPLRQGDKVFDDVSAERLWDIGHGLMPLDIAKNLTMPTVLPNNVNNNSVNVHYDNMIAVQGSLNSTDVKQMEAIVDRGINKIINKIHDGLTYGR